MSGLVPAISLWLYVAAPAWMLHRGWPTRAGITMIAAALLPWIVWLSDNEPLGPGSGFALMFTAILLLLGLVALGVGIRRAILRNRLNRKGRQPTCS